MQKVALITGVLGQDGPYLAKFLLNKDYKVYGLMRRCSHLDFANTDYLGIVVGVVKTRKLINLDGILLIKSY